MKSEDAASHPPARKPRDGPVESEGDPISQNIAAVLDFYAREERKISASQRVLERISSFVGQPAFLGSILIFVTLWILANAGLGRLGLAEFDPAPFFWLQGVIALYAALITTFVLATQNREKRHAEQRAYLELQINLLAEQKTAKVIALLEELRRDMPTVRDRIDHQADAMQMPVDTAAVMNVLEETLDAPTEEEMRISNEPSEP